MRGQGFEIGADFVADITAAGGAVGAGNAQVDFAMLHQVATRIVHDHIMRHAMRCQFPGG